jgi:hypothetical protein
MVPVRSLTIEVLGIDFPNKGAGLMLSLRESSMQASVFWLGNDTVSANSILAPSSSKSAI